MPTAENALQAPTPQPQSTRPFLRLTKAPTCNNHPRQSTRCQWNTSPLVAYRTHTGEMVLWTAHAHPHPSPSHRAVGSYKHGGLQFAQAPSGRLSRDPSGRLPHGPHRGHTQCVARPDMPTHELSDSPHQVCAARARWRPLMFREFLPVGLPSQPAGPAVIVRQTGRWGAMQLRRSLLSRREYLPGQTGRGHLLRGLGARCALQG